MSSKRTFSEWQELAETVEIRNQAFVGGNYVDAASGETFDCISPIDGRLLAKVAACDTEDVNRAVSAARKAFEAGVWAAMEPQARKRVLLKLADLIERHADELAVLETLDMGKPITYSRYHDLNSVVHTIRWYAEAIDKVYGEIAPLGTEELGLIMREPIGVVGAVVPWNFPLDIAASKFAPALAAGNCVILKPAEQAPLTAIRVAELAAEAGIPDGVLQVLPGFGHTAGQALGRHPEVDLISFTGSTEVGKLFLKYAGESNMKEVALECGGKSPNIILADAPDLEAAAAAATDGIFYNSGQVCTASSRLLVHRQIHEAFLEKVVEAARQTRPGNPLDPDVTLGTIVDEQQVQRILSYIETGQREGAALVLGGRRARPESGGCYLEPTIFEQVAPHMTIAQEEIFGPVLATIPFDADETAIQIANDSIYGLFASVWTRDINKAHKFARAIRAGTVSINTLKNYDVRMPFGGYKQSGIGRENSLHGYYKYTQLKSILIGLE